MIFFYCFTIFLFFDKQMIKSTFCRKIISSVKKINIFSIKYTI